MDIAEFIRAVPAFYSMSRVDQILLLAWYLHVHRGSSLFTSDTMRSCFRELHVEPPDTSVYLPRLASKKPAQLIRERGGYRLAGGLRRNYDSAYGEAPMIASVSALLSSLPEKVDNLAEKDFLKEALDCYRVRAFRAAIVMTWNLAFDHIREWIFADQVRVQKFNSAIAARFPKKAISASCVSDLEEFKESEVLEICRSARLYSKNISSILQEKLGRRNIAAHPSQVEITQHQADDVITDLVNNVVLRLS